MFHITKLYIPYNGNNVVEMIRDCIDEQLIEWHNDNGESTKKSKILAIREAFK